MAWVHSVISQMNMKLNKWPVMGNEVMHKLNSIKNPGIETTLLTFNIDRNKTYFGLDEIIQDINK